MVDRGGDTLLRATPISVAQSRTYKDAIGGIDRNDFYQFRLNSNTASSFNLSISQLPATAKVSLLSSKGSLLQRSVRANQKSQRISKILADGSYYLRVSVNRSAKKTAYRLAVSAMPIEVNPSVLPTLSIADTTIAEGNTAATFNIFLSQASSEPVTVAYTTVAETATPGQDYQPATGTLTFAPGETRQSIAVEIIGDIFAEPNETFNVVLNSPSRATLADAIGEGTIINDNTAPVVPALSVKDITLKEGDRGTTDAIFTVTLSAASSQTITVSYATQDKKAAAGVDYRAASGILRFMPFQTAQAVRVAVAGDRLFEDNETLTLNLSEPSNATIGIAAGILTIQNDDIQRQVFDYGDAVQKSVLFYEAQRSGKLPATNRISWRGDSALSDGADVGVDLTGGYYDAGDHVKFGFPLAASMTMLSWGAIQYRDANQRSGEMPDLLDAIKWGTDYILKAHTAPNQLWGQVGLGDLDHAYWGSAETMTMARPAFKIDAQRPGSDLAGESAAALAAASIAFRPIDPLYADRLYQNAVELFSFADTYRGKYSDSIPDAAKFYNSSSGYNDELVWSALWLHKAAAAIGASDTFYLNKAKNLYNTISVAPNWTQSWDNKSYGAAILLAQETGDIQYLQDVETWLNYWTDKSGNGIPYTSGGLAWLSDGGALRYTANTAFLAGIYADTVRDPNRRYSSFAENQIDYMLGNNPNDRSYVIGVGQNSPQNPHHRGSHGSTTNSINDPVTNRYPLTGALVGGLIAADDNAFEDDRSLFRATEAALDYNAGFTGALARMYQEFAPRSIDG